MSERLSELRIVDPVLSQIADSYSNAELVYNRIFPTVRLSKETGKIPLFDKSNFNTYDTERAIRADSNRIAPTGVTTSDFEMIEHDVEMALDKREISEADQSLLYETRITRELQEVLEVEKELAVATYCQNPGNFSNTDDLNDKWATANTATPIADIKAGIAAIIGAVGKPPNTMIIAQDAFNLLMATDEITAIVQYSGLAIASQDTLKALFDIPNIYIGKSYYSDDGDTLTKIWSDICILAYVDQNDKSQSSIYNPSFAYMLEKQGYPQVDTYEENGGKIKVIRNTDIYTKKVVGETCAYLLFATGV